MENMSTRQHLIIVDVGVCGLLDFDFRSFVVMTRWSGKKQRKPGKNSIYGIISGTDQSVMSQWREDLSRSCDSRCHS